jgi:phage pi2 protein 07
MWRKRKTLCIEGGFVFEARSAHERFVFEARSAHERFVFEARSAHERLTTYFLFLYFYFVRSQNCET